MQINTPIIEWRLLVNSPTNPTNIFLSLLYIMHWDYLCKNTNMSSIASVLQKQHLINEAICAQMATIQVLPPWKSIARPLRNSDCFQTLKFSYRGDDIWGETGKMRIFFLRLRKFSLLGLYLLTCKIRILRAPAVMFASSIQLYGQGLLPKSCTLATSHYWFIF